MVLGLRDTVDFGDKGFRFENWRRTILYSFPNGSAPLTALLALMRSESTNDPHFHWGERPLPLRRTQLSEAYTNVATSIKLVDKVFRPGQLIVNEDTDEIMLLGTVTGSGPYTYNVTRGEWGTAVASSGAADFIGLNGNANEEGADTPESISGDPTPKDNYTQIFRTPIKLTGTALRTSLKFEKNGPYAEKIREALEQQSVDMEWSFIQGKAAEFTGPDGEPMRTTDGIIRFLPDENIVDVDVDGGGYLNKTLFNHYLERAFRVTSNKANEKLLLCGSGALGVINNIAEGSSTMNVVPGEEAFGMDLTRWITPHGTVYIKTHPLFTQHPRWRYHALIIDVRNLVYRYLTGRDLTKLINRQGNGQDRRVDEFLAECGLEVHHGQTHFWIKNIKCFNSDLYCPNVDGIGQI